MEEYERQYHNPCMNICNPSSKFDFLLDGCQVLITDMDIDF